MIWGQSYLETILGTTELLMNRLLHCSSSTANNISAVTKFNNFHKMRNTHSHLLACQSRRLNHYSDLFGSFGLSTKEPYTIMLCLSSLALVLSSSSVHTSPWHRVRHRNFIFGIYMHIKYLVIPTCSFQMAAILVFFFDLLSCLHR